MASTLISGTEDAVHTDPGMTADQARMLGDRVAAKGRNLTDIFITHGHGDHWFAAGLLAERFGARVVATAGTIAQMHASVAARPFLWDRLYQGIPPSPVTAVTVPGDRFTLEGHDLVIVEVGHTDSGDTSVLNVPDLGLVVAGDVIYNGVHMYLARARSPAADRSQVEASPRHIVRHRQAARRRRRGHRGDPALPGRRRRAPASREHRHRVLQRRDRAISGPSRADGPVGECQRALRRPRPSRSGPRPDHPCLLAVNYAVGAGRTLNGPGS